MNIYLQITRALVASCWLGLVIAANASAGVTITDKGRSQYRIVLPADPIPAERYAAEELQRYLEKMSGAKLSIVSDLEPPSSREIILGSNSRLGKLAAKVDFHKLGADGFVLRVDGNRLIIAGGRPRGTLNGVYTLLEEKLGVRWFTPGLETVPRVDRVKLPKLNETKVPALENRDVFWHELMGNPDFAARHRVNGQHYGLTGKHGGAFTVYHPFVHSFDALVPQELFKDHPEYF